MEHEDDPLFFNKKKRTYYIVGVGEPLSENKEKRNKTMEHESDGDTYCWRYVWNSTKSLGIKTGRIGNQKKNLNLLN